LCIFWPHQIVVFDTFEKEGSHIISKAHGAYIVDSDGHTILDGIGGLWCVNVGHGRQEMADSIAEQVMSMEYFNPFGHTTNAPAALLAAKLAELAPGDLNMGAGGVLVAPKDYHKRMWEICQKYDLLYVADEVVTAFGRLGHMFASEDVTGIQPDIINTAKGLTSGYIPLSATLISDKIYDVISNPQIEGSGLSRL